MFPVLWLCGPPGVGKSAVGWAVHELVAGSGFVDIDQLGMCYPERPSDPGRHLLEAGNLVAVIEAQRAAGRRCLVVSGVVDARRGIPPFFPDVSLTLCRLRADDDELVRRFTGREGRTGGVPRVVAEASLLDEGLVGGRVVETTDRSVADVARDCVAGWPVAPAGRVISFCGPPGVGTSTIGFQVYLLLGAGRTASYLDLGQLAFGADPAVVAPEVWANFREAGAELLVTVGPPVPFPGSDVTVIGLECGPEELLRRLRDRAAGKSWPEPGDPVRGKPDAHLRDLAAEAKLAEPVDLRIDTDGRTPHEVAEEIFALLTH